ncbi:MAG: MarR family winged helix-turn-helix transcriptional regulator [Gemmatimonadaceae bacterium]
MSVDAFRRVLRELRIAARRTELETGLSAAQMFVLTAANDSPGASLNAIAEQTMTDRSSVAAIVDRLVEQGLATRDKSGDDRRRASVAVTARGKRAMGKSAPAPTALLIAGLRALNPAELKGLSKGLIALTRGMGIAHQPPGMLFEDSKPARRARAKSARR